MLHRGIEITKTVGDIRAAVDAWQEGYRSAAQADRGRRLLNRSTGAGWRPLLTDEVNALVLNLSFVLLSEKVALWADDEEPVDTRVWRRVTRYLRGNRYGRREGRYVVRLYGARSHPIAITANALAVQRPDVRLGDLYGALAFDMIGVTDRRGPWAPAAARRVGQCLLGSLARDHRLELRVSAGPEELLFGIQADHDQVQPQRRLDRYTETVVSAFQAEGYHCGLPATVARNARLIPLARKRALRPALVLLPDAGRPADAVSDDAADVVLLPTARVIADYGQVIACTPTRALRAAADAAHVRLRPFEDLLRAHNRRALVSAVRDLAANG